MQLAGRFESGGEAAGADAPVDRDLQVGRKLAAFGLTMTLVWIYLEFLRLISILSSSD